MTRRSTDDVLAELSEYFESCGREMEREERRVLALEAHADWLVAQSSSANEREIRTTHAEHACMRCGERIPAGTRCYGVSCGFSAGAGVSWWYCGVCVPLEVLDEGPARPAQESLFETR